MGGRGVMEFMVFHEAGFLGLIATMSAYVLAGLSPL